MKLGTAYSTLGSLLYSWQIIKMSASLFSNSPLYIFKRLGILASLRARLARLENLVLVSSYSWVWDLLDLSCFAFNSLSTGVNSLTLYLAFNLSKEARPVCPAVSFKVFLEI